MKYVVLAKSSGSVARILDREWFPRIGSTLPLKVLSRESNVSKMSSDDITQPMGN
jgi:hypothetical protein